MYILYLDESGDLAGDAEYYVLAGPAVYERQAFFLSREIEAVQAKYLPSLPEPIEMHCREIVGGRKPPWDRLDWNARRSLMADVWEVMRRSNPRGVALFGAAFHKPSYPNLDPVLEVVEQVCTRFDIFLQNLSSEGEQQTGLVVVDRSQSDKDHHILRLVRGFRNAQGRFGRLRHFADVPLFADSASTRLLQLADFVAYALFRYYEHCDTRGFNQIASRFHERDNVMHGLVHLSKSFETCACPACTGRRVRRVFGGEW